MPTLLKKLLLTAGALLIAGAVSYYPWTYLDELPGNAGYVYFMTSIFWAPAAVLFGVVAGFLFAFALWPRKPKPGPAKPGGSTTLQA